MLIFITMRLSVRHNLFVININLLQFIGLMDNKEHGNAWA